MRKEYDFTDSLKNPFTDRLKKQISIRIDIDTIDYFKSLSEDVKIPYQKLMNLYLADCARRKKRLKLVTKKGATALY